MSGQIFISYRREESGWVAGRLRDRLLRVFDWQGHHCFDEREAACRVSVAHRALGAFWLASLSLKTAQNAQIAGHGYDHFPGLRSGLPGSHFPPLIAASSAWAALPSARITKR